MNNAHLISDKVETFLKNRTVLITGGTGSFGSTMATRILACDPSHVIIFSRDEDKQVRMMRDFPDFEFMIGDVRDPSRIEMATRGVDVIFHAAALKHVPFSERHPYEAYQTNVMGSWNLAAAAIRNEVEIVIGLSTDKAVKPVNAMGISKAMMEKIFSSQNFQHLPTRFCCTRYGNVVGSRGSVVPLFFSQLERGEALTITNPEMTRFLMHLSESVDLVFHALLNAHGGEIFVRKAPACTVQLLAEAVILLHGGQGKMQNIGLRPGEKMHEALVSEFELQRCEESPEFFSISPEYRPSQTNCSFPPGVDYTSANTKQLSTKEEVAAILAESELITTRRFHS